MSSLEHSLFPRSPEELAKASFSTVMRVLEKERGARKHVFRNDPKQLHKKVKEIDEALASLKILYRLATEVK